MRRLAVIMLVLCCSLMLGSITVKRGPGGGMAVNQPTDTNGDGSPDTITCGDYDGDGSLQTDDVQACVDALTDTGAKVVRLAAGSTFTSDHLAADTLNGSNVHGMVELPSDITLDCQGSAIEGLTHIQANEWSLNTFDVGIMVVTNSDHTTRTDEKIIVRDCVLDGGMPNLLTEMTCDAASGTDYGISCSVDSDCDSGAGACIAGYDNSGWQAVAGIFYQGIALYGCTDCLLQNTIVRDTTHSGIYIQNPTRVKVQGNTAKRVGSFSEQGQTFGQPGIYVFQSDEEFQAKDVLVTGNFMGDSGSSAYVARVGGCGGSCANWDYRLPLLSGVTFSNNTASWTPGLDASSNALPAPATCATLTGLRDSAFIGNTCVRTRGIEVGQTDATVLCEDITGTGSTEWASTCRVTVQNNSIYKTSIDSSSWAAIYQWDNQQDITYSNNIIDGVDSFDVPNGTNECMWLNHPMKSILIDGGLMKNCGRNAIVMAGTAPSDMTPSQGITIKGLTVQNIGAEALLMDDNLTTSVIWTQSGSHKNIKITDMTATGINGRGFNVTFPIDGLEVDGWTQDNFAARYAGSFTGPTLPACAPDDSGTADATSTTTRLDDSAQAWTAGEWKDHILHITAGTSSGTIRYIETNDTDSIFIRGGMTAPDATSTFVIYQLKNNDWAFLTSGDCDGNAAGTTDMRCICNQATSTWADLDFDSTQRANEFSGNMSNWSLKNFHVHNVGRPTQTTLDGAECIWVDEGGDTLDGEAGILDGFICDVPRLGDGIDATPNTGFRDQSDGGADDPVPAAGTGQGHSNWRITNATCPDDTITDCIIAGDGSPESFIYHEMSIIEQKADPGAVTCTPGMQVVVPGDARYHCNIAGNDFVEVN